MAVAESTLCAAHTCHDSSGNAQQPAAMACPLPQEEKEYRNRTNVEEVIDHSILLPIPSPPHQHYMGLLGHAPDLDPVLPVRTYWQLMDQYSPIFQLDLNMPYPRVFVGSRELVNEMADDTRFTKFTHRLHREMRAVFGDGLFSAESTDKAWWKAHRLLIPAFGRFPWGLIANRWTLTDSSI